MIHKKINNYIIHFKDVLGEGSFGKVYKGQQQNNHQIVAVKVLQKDKILHDQYLKQALFSQIRILQLLKSQNVIRVIEALQSSHNYYIIQQLCESDLQKHLKMNSVLTEDIAIAFLKQICNGFIALVKEGIVHRDLKPANIMLHKGTLKIGDYGFAKRNITKQIKNVSSVGTPLYMPPQVLRSQAYTSKCDVWATGLIFYQMLHGKTPWSAHTEFELARKLETVKLEMKQNLKQQTKSFLRGCLQYSEANRFSWDEVFVHPIFEGYFSQYAEQNKLFEDKLKMVMAQLRFEINSKNIDLTRLLQNLDLSGVKQLSYTQFQRFVRHIHPILTKQQIHFFFEKMDSNADGSVALSQLAKQMERHYISFSKFIPGHHDSQHHGFTIKKAQSINQGLNNYTINSQLQAKVKKCFIKLYKIVTSNRIKLYKMFETYDIDKKGSLTIDEFQTIMLKFDQFTHQEIVSVFNYLESESQSNNMKFADFRSYYCKVNGIAETLEMPQHLKSHHSHSHSHSHHHSSSGHSHHHHHHHHSSTHKSTTSSSNIASQK